MLFCYLFSVQLTLWLLRPSLSQVWTLFQNQFKVGHETFCWASTGTSQGPQVGKNRYSHNSGTGTLRAFGLLAPPGRGRLKQYSTYFAISTPGGTLVERVSEYYLNLFDQLFICHEQVYQLCLLLHLSWKLLADAKAYRKWEPGRTFSVYKKWDCWWCSSEDALRKTEVTKRAFRRKACKLCKTNVNLWSICAKSEAMNAQYQRRCFGLKCLLWHTART